MAAETDPQPAPAEYSFQVTIRRGVPGGSGAFSLITGPQQTADEAIAQIEQLRDQAIADGLAERPSAAPADVHQDGIEAAQSALQAAAAAEAAQPPAGV